MCGVGCQQRPHRFLKIIKLKNLKEQIKALKVNRWVNVVTFVLFGHGSLSLVLSSLQICLIGELGTTHSKSILVSNVFSFTSICVICRITYMERVIVSHEPRPPTLSERFSAYCWGSCLPSCDNPLSCLFGTLTCGGSSQSRNGSSWQSSPRQSASLAWPRSVCTKLRITGDYCCWPPPRATPTWWASWQRGRRGTGRPTWPFSPASCRDGGWKKRGRDGTGSFVWIHVSVNLYVLLNYLNFFLLSFLVFAQIGQMSGASHQNRSIARGCISGENVSAQPCVKVKSVLPSAQHMPGCWAPVCRLRLCANNCPISICVEQKLCM